MKPITHFVYTYKIPTVDKYKKDLLYSIRSLHKHFKDPFDITIIGELPEWVNPDEVTFIHNPISPPGTSPQASIFNAFKKAAVAYDDFVRIDDDMILIHDTTIEELQYHFYIGELDVIYTESINSDKTLGIYVKHLLKTRKLLMIHGKPTRNFSNHTTVCYNSKLMQDMIVELGLDKQNWKSITHTMDTLYLNYNHDKLEYPVVHAELIRLGIWGKHETRITRLKNLLINNETRVRIFNYDEKGLDENPEISDILSKHLPDKSPIEL